MKELQVATDFYPEVYWNHRFYDTHHIQAMMAYSRSLGASTVQWIMDDMWALYDGYPGGMDLLKTAIDAAHAEGLKFHMVYKPDEGCLAHLELPHTAPRPAGTEDVVWEDLRGLLPIVRPFIAQHPEMCIKRWPGDEDPGDNVRAIRLFKNDNEPMNLKAGDVSIWISDVNGRFQRYDGPFTVEESSEWRLVFPLGRTCRVVTIKGLDIPAQQRYVEVRLTDGALDGQPFRNEYEALVELVNDAGQVIPCTPAIADPPGTHNVKDLAQPHMRQLIRYGHYPEVQAFLDAPDAIAEHASEMRAYGRAPSSRMYALDEKGLLSVARGKIPYQCGVLNPVYPEVREHWLDAVRYAIERGADAVDIRFGHHGRLQENWAYGFNEPVLKALGGRVDLAGMRRVIGDATTQFLREARDLCHAHGRKLGVHLMTTFLRPRDEPTDIVHEGRDHQWETWVAEIADFATIRGAMGMREESIRYTVDCFANACREANIPVVYQSNRRIYTHKPDPVRLDPDRLKYLEHEMAYALNHPGLAGFQFYETAFFTRLDDNGQFQGCEELRDMTRQFGFLDSQPQKA